MKAKKSKGKTPYPRVHFPAGPNYGDYVNAEKAAAGRLNKVEKLDPIKPKRVNNDEGMKALLSLPKAPQRSKATIPVPAKKKKRRLRKRK